MTQDLDAVVAGHLCLDVIPRIITGSKKEFEQVFVPGRLLEVGPITVATGGAVSNTGLVLHKLGIKTQLMGKIGDDLFGGAVKQVINACGPFLVDGMIVDPAAQTSYTVVINPPQTDRIFLHCPAANDTFNAADVDYDRVARARLFHLGYPPLLKRMYADNGIELTQIFSRVKAAGVTTSLDMSLPDSSAGSGQADWYTILQRVLPYVDIFLPSLQEILYMLPDDVTGNSSNPLAPQVLANVADTMLAMGVKIAGIKLGQHGFYLQTAAESVLAGLGRAKPTTLSDWANKTMWTPAFQVTEVGATGAGDSAIAGFLAGLLRGLSAEETLIAAAAVGACNVEAADSLSGIRSWNQTQQRIAAGWLRCPLALTDRAWHFDPVQQLWVKE